MLLQQEDFSNKWPIVPLNDVVDFLDNKRKPIKASDRVEGEFSYYGANGYQGTINDYIFDEPLLLLAEDGGHFGNPDKKIAYIAHGKYWVNNHAHVLKPKDSLLDLKYLYYVMHKYDVTPFIKGATRAKLTKGDTAKIPIPLPPLPEQERIAKILDQVDKISSKRQQSIQLADEFIKSLFMDMFGDPIGNPKEWPAGTIRDLVAEAKYGTSKKAHPTDGKFPMLRMGNITYLGDFDFSDLKYVDLEEQEEIKYLVRKNDLLFNRTNSKELVGKTAVYLEDKPMAVAGYLVRVRTNEKGNPHYISAFLNSDYGKDILQGKCNNIVGMANINAQKMQDIEILLPPVELQNKFAEIVVFIKEKAKRLHNSATELDNLFASLSQRAFAGEL